MKRSQCRRLVPHCDLVMMMRSANGVSEVKNMNLVERCVKHPGEKGTYKVLWNAGGLRAPHRHQDLNVMKSDEHTK